MNNWKSKSYTAGTNELNRLPATAALDRMSQGNGMLGSKVAVGVNGHRASLDSAMTMQLRKRFDTSDLFQSLNSAEEATFPEIKWCAIAAEESQRTAQPFTGSSSQNQLHQQQSGLTGHVVGGGFQKTQTWPRR